MVLVNLIDFASAVAGTNDRVDFDPVRRRAEVLMPRLQELVSMLVDEVFDLVQFAEAYQ